MYENMIKIKYSNAFVEICKIILFIFNHKSIVNQELFFRIEYKIIINNMTKIKKTKSLTI